MTEQAQNGPRSRLSVVVPLKPEVFKGMPAVRKTWPAWMYALMQLKPQPGAQLVDFAEASRAIRNALPLLVDVGYLRPLEGSPTKFYLPRKFACARMEEFWIYPV